MTNIQEIGCQLMKSPRELASWNFPLSEILEEYFNLLPEPCNIHYGEAALVIQNSVNAYVRRVEELYDETRFLSQKIILEFKDNDKNQKDRRSKKCVFDFSHFELLDFDKEIGKTINLRDHEEKPMKFLHRYFSQLENFNAGLRIEILDIQGEIIGKKYDFRCNQRTARSGLLVEEFTPEDFKDENILENSLYSSPSTVNDSLNYSPMHSSEPDTTSKDIISTDIEKEIFEGCQSKFLIKRSNEIDFEKLNNCNINNSETEFYNTEDKIKNVDNDADLCNTDVENMSENATRHVPSGSIENQSTEKILNATNNIEDVENILKNHCKRKSLDDINNKFIEIESASKSQRSKRFKDLKNSEKDNSLSDVKLLKPIPFEEGVPKKLIKSRAEFRLPCHISLLKHNSKKRKLVKNKVREKISKSDSDHNIPKGNSKIEVYSPTRQFITPKEEDQRAFERSTNEGFKNKECFIVNYEPVTNLTMELLGFHPRYAKDDSHIIFTEKESPPRFNSNASSPLCASSSSPPPESLEQQGFTQDIYRESEIDNEKTEIRKKHGYDFEKAVKHKIKKIYKELDLETDEDQKVAKWHQEIKPRLIEAQRKPPFHIHEYETRIIQRLEMNQRKLQFDEMLREEPPSEVARYFSATLHLASTNNLNINATEDPDKRIEIVLLD